MSERCWKRIERKKSPTEIPWSVRRNLGRPWRKTLLACCCYQRWQETTRFSNRQVSTQGTEEAQIEAMTLVTNGTGCPNSAWGYYRWPHHCVSGYRLLCVE